MPNWSAFAPPAPVLARVVAERFRIKAIPFALGRPQHPLFRILDTLSLKLPRQLASLLLAIKRTRGLDALIVPGTGILDDFQEGPFGMPLVLFGWCLAARLAGARILFVSIGAGPIDHPLSRWLMTSSVAMADYRSYRDDLSKRFMAGIGFDASDDPVYPDIAFALPSPPAAERPNAAGPLVVGLGVMNYHGWDGEGGDSDDIYEVYLEKIAAFALWLLQEGHILRILTGAKGDKPTVADLLEMVRAKADAASLERLIYEPITTLQDVMDQIDRDRPRRGDALSQHRQRPQARQTLDLDRLCREERRPDGGDGPRRFLPAHRAIVARSADAAVVDRLAAGRETYAAGIRAVQADYRRQLQHQDMILTRKLDGEERMTEVDVHA